MRCAIGSIQYWKIIEIMLRTLTSLVLYQQVRNSFLSLDNRITKRVIFWRIWVYYSPKHTWHFGIPENLVRLTKTDISCQVKVYGELSKPNKKIASNNQPCWAPYLHSAGKNIRDSGGHKTNDFSLFNPDLHLRWWYWNNLSRSAGQRSSVQIASVVRAGNNRRPD